MKSIMHLSKKELDNLTKIKRDFLCSYLFNDIIINDDLSMSFIFNTKKAHKVFEKEFKNI